MKNFFAKMKKKNDDKKNKIAMKNRTQELLTIINQITKDNMYYEDVPIEEKFQVSYPHYVDYFPDGKYVTIISCEYDLTETIKPYNLSLLIQLLFKVYYGDINFLFRSIREYFTENNLEKTVENLEHWLREEDAICSVFNDYDIFSIEEVYPKKDTFFSFAKETHFFPGEYINKNEEIAFTIMTKLKCDNPVKIPTEKDNLDKYFYEQLEYILRNHDDKKSLHESIILYLTELKRFNKLRTYVNILIDVEKYKLFIELPEFVEYQKFKKELKTGLNNLVTCYLSAEKEKIKNKTKVKELDKEIKQTELKEEILTDLNQLKLYK